MSPGTTISVAIISSGGVIVAVVSCDSTSTPNERSINSVWFLDNAGSVTLVLPSAYNPANNTQDFTCADATGES